MNDITLSVMKMAETKFWKAFNEYKETEKNDNVLLFLAYSYNNNFNNKTSLFGEHVFLDEYGCQIKKQNDNYKFDIHCNIVNDKGTLLIKYMQFSFEVPVNNINKKYAPKMLEQLINAGINGFLTTPFEKEDLIKLNALCLSLPNPKFKYVCDECHKEYKTAKRFLKHLETTKHKDSIYTQYGYWN